MGISRESYGWQLTNVSRKEVYELNPENNGVTAGIDNLTTPINEKKLIEGLMELERMGVLGSGINAFIYRGKGERLWRVVKFECIQNPACIWAF